MLKENPKWILSTVLAILTLLVPIILYLLSSSGKSLQYEIVSASELINEEFPTKDLELKIKGENVDQVNLFTFRISNSGSEPIKKEDFERQISINVPYGTKIYLARLKKKNPENLTPKYELSNNKLLIEPLLLNPDEEFEIELFSSSHMYPTIDARIVGISKIKKKFPESTETIRISIMIALSFLLMVSYSRFIRLTFSNSFYSPNLLMRLGNGILSLVCSFASVILLNGAIDIANNKTLVFSIALIPYALGSFWAAKDEQYYKTMQSVVTDK